jgi:ABC-type transport system involved in cytochrome bd biosynthesis fused ATPase/permease subunit
MGDLKCVVTGGRGLVGRHLVLKFLKEEKFSVTVADIGPEIEVCARLTWSDLWVSVTDAKGEDQTVLHGFSGYAEPGGMLAILGPSGSGQLTLLDSLAGKKN